MEGIPEIKDNQHTYIGYYRNRIISWENIAFYDRVPPILNIQEPCGQVKMVGNHRVEIGSMMCLY